MTLRGLAQTSCKVPDGGDTYHGWHFSYAMDLEHILSKIKSFKGSDEITEAR